MRRNRRPHDQLLVIQRRLRGLVTLFILVLAIMAINADASAADSIEFYVSADGNDRASGSEKEPFATISRAQQAVRSSKGECIVFVRGGRYELASELVFGPEDSNTTYSAVAGETPVLSGGTLVKDWKIDGSHWRSTIEGDFLPRSLFVNDQRRPRARWPNEGFFTGLETTDGVTITFPADKWNNWKNPGEVELVTYVEWTMSRVRLPSANNPAVFPFKILQFIQGEGTQHVRNNIPHMPFYFENSPELLDAPGEWYFDASTRELSYLPLPGETPQNIVAVATRLPTLINIEGRLDSPVTNLRFVRIEFAHSNWELPKNGFMPIQAGLGRETVDHVSRQTSAVRISFAEHCRFDACNFTSLSGTGLELDRGCRSIVIDRCEFYDIGGTGIQVNDAVLWEGNYRARKADQEPDKLAARDTVISNCRVHHCAKESVGSVGIYVGNTDHTTVSHNEVSDLPYTGISIGWNWTHQFTDARKNVVEFNHVHHVMQSLADGAGIYMLGNQPESILRGNLIHDVTQSNGGLSEANGIFMDNGSEGWKLEDNVIYKTSNAPIRYNTLDTGPQFQSVGKNYFGIAPGEPNFPTEIARKAGPQVPEANEKKETK